TARRRRRRSSARCAARIAFVTWTGKRSSHGWPTTWARSTRSIRSRGQRADPAGLLRAARPRRGLHTRLAASRRRPEHRGLRRDHARRRGAHAEDARHARPGRNLASTTVPRTHRLTCEHRHNPGCRHHHGAKLAPGGPLAQPEPGVFIWTLPNGRQFTTIPGHYPG